MVRSKSIPSSTVLNSNNIGAGIVIDIKEAVILEKLRQSVLKSDRKRSTLYLSKRGLKF